MHMLMSAKTQKSPKTRKVDGGEGWREGVGSEINGATLLQTKPTYLTAIG